MTKYTPIIALLAAGCSYNSMSMGVTTGGAQDMNLARDIIANGGIPHEGSFTSEGLFSEHDLPIEGAPCAEILCPQTAMSQVSNSDNEQNLLAQLGFSTSITSENFQRRPLNISAAVDISGSMRGEKLDMTKEALLLMVDQLNENDHMSLVTYGNSAKIKKRTLQMNDYGKWAMKRSIEGLSPGGSTNMEEGMLKAYGLIENRLDTVDVEHRLMLFTDAQPNTGATGSDSFFGIANEYSDKGIGLSVFGVGLDLGAELTNEIAKTRGGNSYFLSDKEYTQKLFGEEFDFVVSPIAYNLQVNLNLDDQVSLDSVYGTPNAAESDTFSFGASTLFLSARNGGIGVLLQADDFIGKLGSLDIQYETIDGELREDSAHLQYTGGEWVSSSTDADDLGVFKMSHLLLEYKALKAGSDFCLGLVEKEEALEIVEYAKVQLLEASELLDSEELMSESQLMTDLHANISTEAVTCHSEEMYEYY